MTIQLIRQKTTGKAVIGQISLPFDPLNPLVYPTLENADFLIPEGTYPLEITWSPRFKKFMPLIDQVPDREGIRIHMGTKPEHSQGCVLVSYLALENIKAFINYHNKNSYDNEELKIRITGE